MVVIDKDLRRALHFIVPYWRRLTLVLALSVASTALSLYLPILSRDFFDGALIGRDVTTLIRVVLAFAAVSVASFITNIVSGLRYTRVSADILFDMRLEMYRHLQRLSPRFYARTRLGDVMSRINNDIGEIQRIASETALASATCCRSAAPSRCWPGWMCGCSSSPRRRCRSASGPWFATAAGSKPKSPPSASAAPTSAAF